MRIRSYRIPFSELVGPEATEIEFDPDTDYLLVRSLYAKPTSEIREFVERITSLTNDTSQDEADRLVLDLLGHVIVEWHLAGPDGPIAQPKTAKQLNSLPGSIRGALIPFFAEFRGRPDPTPAS